MLARHRLPDPPNTFVGRRREVAWLAAAVERAPVTAVWGPGGIGKTALALHTLHAHVGRRAEQGLRVSLRGLDPARGAHLEVLQALAQARQLTRIDWAGLAGDVDGLTAAVIDLAESAPCLVLLEDVHHADRAQVRDLLLQLARYARHSRWLALGRDELAISELPGQVLRLAPMQSTELREVANALAPELSEGEVRIAVERASGSPWTLQQVLGAGPAPTDAVSGLLDDLDASTVRFLRTLALLDAPISPEALRDVVDVPDDAPTERLLRRGLVERHDEGLSLHDVVRDELRGAAERERDRVVEVGRGLGASDDTAAALEGARLLAELGDVEALADVLEAAGEQLLAEGHASRLWSHLEPASAARLVPWRLRCALELGDVRTLRAASPPEKSTPSDRLVWARVLWARRDLDEALRVAGEVARAGEPPGEDGALRHEAALLAAQSLVQLGRVGEAAELLRAHDPPDREAGLHRDVLEASCMRLLGELDGARAKIAELLEPVLRMKGSAREESVFTLAHGAFELGMLQDSRRLIEQLAKREERWSPALFEGRQTLMLHAALAVLEGDLPTARDALDRLEPYVQRASHLRARLRLARCMVRALAGDLDGYEESLAAATQDARQVGHPDSLALASALAHQWASLNALAAPAPELLLGHDAPLEGARPDLARYAVLERAHHATRAGDHAQGRPVEPTEEDGHAGLGGFRLVIDALRALLADEGDRACELAGEAVRLCRSMQHAAREAEARHALCEVHLAVGDLAGLRKAATELAAHAERCSSDRMAGEARFFRLAAEGALDEPSSLELLATRERVAPAAARRAQALLGGRPRLDAIDRRVLAAIRGEGRMVRVELVQPFPEEDTPWEPGWGIDERTATLWLEDGRILSLAHRRLLIRLLAAIADRQGEATKEDLVLSVWEEREYHPLHHDNRLHSAVRKLRRLIEDDPTQPRRVLTTEAGYALGAPTRRVRARGD